eukprot:TRINITY_DN910_c2_g1_i1.p1 TRINITY_DN910_c2_g1~~TRINITY_DN910_c2_g1_i1.p1  ORF type:complete len:956 (-),score=368.65 TRINITY_DN910_c2_g1_i1:2649-5516(-)
MELPPPSPPPWEPPANRHRLSLIPRGRLRRPFVFDSSSDEEGGEASYATRPISEVPWSDFDMLISRPPDSRVLASNIGRNELLSSRYLRLYAPRSDDSPDGAVPVLHEMLREGIQAALNPNAERATAALVSSLVSMCASLKTDPGFAKTFRRRCALLNEISKAVVRARREAATEREAAIAEAHQEAPASPATVAVRMAVSVALSMVEAFGQANGALLPQVVGSLTAVLASLPVACLFVSDDDGASYGRGVKALREWLLTALRAGDSQGGSVPPMSDQFRMQIVRLLFSLSLAGGTLIDVAALANELLNDHSVRRHPLAVADFLGRLQAYTSHQSADHTQPPIAAPAGLEADAPFCWPPLSDADRGYQREFSIASDGEYLYVCDGRFLCKVPSGYGALEFGQFSNYFYQSADDNVLGVGQLVFLGGVLRFYSYTRHTLTTFDRDTLREIPSSAVVIRPQRLTAPSFRAVSDGRSLFFVAVASGKVQLEQVDIEAPTAPRTLLDWKPTASALPEGRSLNTAFYTNGAQLVLFVRRPNETPSGLVDADFFGDAFAFPIAPAGNKRSAMHQAASHGYRVSGFHLSEVVACFCAVRGCLWTFEPKTDTLAYHSIAEIAPPNPALHRCWAELWASIGADPYSDATASADHVALALMQQLYRMNTNRSGQAALCRFSVEFRMEGNEAETILDLLLSGTERFIFADSSFERHFAMVYVGLLENVLDQMVCNYRPLKDAGLAARVAHLLERLLKHLTAPIADADVADTAADDALAPPRKRARIEAKESASESERLLASTLAKSVDAVVQLMAAIVYADRIDDLLDLVRTILSERSRNPRLDGVLEGLMAITSRHHKLSEATRLAVVEPLLFLASEPFFAALNVVEARTDPAAELPQRRAQPLREAALTLLLTMARVFSAHAADESLDAAHRCNAKFAELAGAVLSVGRRLLLSCMQPDSRLTFE